MATYNKDFRVKNGLIVDGSASITNGLNVGGVQIVSSTGEWVGPSSGLVGPTGADGATGADGPPGPPGADGMDGYDGAPGANGMDGAPGANGMDGAPGANGMDGAPGANGMDGADGAPGDSAYQIAVNNGFTGTEQDWLASLQGSDGDDGTDGMDGADALWYWQGEYNNSIAYVEGDIVLRGFDNTNTGSTFRRNSYNPGFVGASPLNSAYWDIISKQGVNGDDGVDGDPGESAYQIAVNNGFVGTEQQWLASLQSNANSASLYANTGITLAQAAYNQGNSTAAVANTDYTTISTTAGTYGNTTSIPSITLAANGRIIAITNTAITASGSSVYSKKTANYTAVAGDLLIADTTAGTFTITLPASPTTGQCITIIDGNNWKTNNLIIARNSSTIEGLSEDLTVDIQGIRLDIVYDGATWEVITVAALPSGQTSGSTTAGYLQYNGTTKTLGQFDGGTTVPSNTTRLNYDGNLYATTFYGAGTGLTGSALSLSAGNIAAGAANQILYQTNTATTGFITAPSTTGTVLTWNGTSFTWAAGFASTDDTTTNASYYPVIATTAGGSTVKTASTKLYFNPSTGAFSSTSFNSLSDIRFKENIKPIQKNVLDQVNPVEFTWKDTGVKSYGVIAQELEKILPELIETDPSTGVKSVAYTQLIPFLINAVKDLQEQINTLKENKA